MGGKSQWMKEEKPACVGGGGGGWRGGVWDEIYLLHAFIKSSPRYLTGIISGMLLRNITSTVYAGAHTQLAHYKK